MSEDVALTELEAMDRLVGELGRFGVAAGLACDQASRAIALTCAKIDSEVAARQATLNAAEEALRSCQAQRGADCSGQAARVAEARRRLGSARQAAAVATRAATAFHPARARYARESSCLVIAAQSWISARRDDAARYLAIGSTAATGATIHVGSSQYSASSTSPGSSTSVTSIEKPAVIAGGPAGFAMVPLALIDVSNSHVHGAQDFTKGVTPEDLAWGLNALREVVIPAIAMGFGADYFAERDQSEGLVGSRSYSDTFSGFFGINECICLDRQSDGTFRVGNGYHRLWVAARMGITALPARIS